MDVQSNALTAVAPTQPRRTPVVDARLAILGCVALAFLLVWAIAIVLPLVAFGLAVGAAAAWCFWLEKHPEHRGTERDCPKPIANEHSIS